MPAQVSRALAGMRKLNSRRQFLAGSNMPFLSKAQNRWAHSPTGTRALGGPGKVKGWESATDYPSLPERTGMHKNFLQKAIKHPGALTAAAKRNGVSKIAEADKESHSSNPHIRARGALGKRLINKAI